MRRNLDQGTLIILFLLLSCMAYAQPKPKEKPAIRFIHLGVADGLSQSSVLSIVQDKQGFMWFGTRNGLNKYDSRSFKTYRNEPENANSLLSNDYISSLLADDHNHIWIGSVAGLTKYRIRDGVFERILHSDDSPHSLSTNDVTCLSKDSREQVWVGTSMGLNLLTDPVRNTFQPFLAEQYIYGLSNHSKDGLWVGASEGLFLLKRSDDNTYLLKAFPLLNAFLATLPSDHITAISEDNQGSLWIGTQHHGVIKIDTSNGHFKCFRDGHKGLPSNNIRKIISTKNGQLWVGTLKGICVIDPVSEIFRPYQHDPDDNYSLSQNSIYDLYEDRQGVIWVATYYSGINAVYPQNTPFQTYRSSNFYASLSSNVISAIVEDRDGNLWIGTEAEGLNYYNRRNNTFLTYKHEYNTSNSISSNLIKSILIDHDHRVWIGTYAGGLNVFDPNSKTFRHFENNAGTVNTLSNNIYSILEDTQNRFWAGTNRGLYLFDKRTGTFELFENQLAYNVITCLIEDKEANIWAGSSSGLFLLEKHDDSFRQINDLPSSYIYCIYAGSDGNIWAGSNGQVNLYRYNLGTQSMSGFGKADGLAGNAIRGILEDDARNIWVSSDNGLTKLNPETRTLQHYSMKDGLPGNEFSFNSCYKDRHGQFFFGSLNGLVSFRPEQINVNTYVPDVKFTGLRLFNKPVEIGDKTRLLQEELNSASEITFRHHQNIFTVEFAVLNYIKPDKNLYAYKLEGLEKEWNYVDVPSATYTNLPSGHYTFLVKGANNDGVWNETPAKLHIRVLPPFWLTWWAYLIYALLFVSVSFVFIRYLIVRALLKKEHEEHQMKLNFFSYISHEIRTPITLILAPLEKLLEDTRALPSLQNQILPIKNNANRLLRLINELMDFRKVETNNMALCVSESDIVPFVKEIFLAFEDMASSRNIRYSFISEKSPIPVYFDKTQLEKVLFNLLSNAFKFAPKQGDIGVFIHKTEAGVRVEVTDNGQGIRMEKQHRIFTDFYQADEHAGGHLGSGIGLSLSRRIAQLHGGSLSFESRVASDRKNGFTCFTLLLKSGKDHLSGSTIVQHTDWGGTIIPYQQQTKNGFPADDPHWQDNAYRVLIAEDNADLRAFLTDTLTGTYHITSCENGLSAWETTVDMIPDLVLSDVMMPGMDGLQLCRKLKLDERTSHIPVVMLTAMGTVEQQLSGLETGADAYITKPFSPQLLALTIRNLIASKEAMRKKFSQQFDLEIHKAGLSRTDETFLHKVLDIIETHLDDANFDVSLLASKVGMSQPVLYKKIKAVTNLSVNNFIKSTRLKKAAKLLKAGELTIAEVAYTVGFNDRKYFSKEFKKQFGMSPTEYVTPEKDHHSEIE